MALRRALPIASALPGKSVSFAAPTGGWNARDPLARMSPKDAIYLENLFPRGTSVELRKGCKQIAQLPDDVAGDRHNIRTLLSYSGADGAEQLFAACDDGIYDVTPGLSLPTPPTAPAVPDYTPTTANALWEFVNASTAGGNFLMAVNGTDDPILYDGSAWTNPTLTGPADKKLLTTIWSYKSRLYFTYKDSLSFWYSDVNSISGTLHEFPLAVLCNKGGYLMAIMNWTYATQFSVTERVAMVTSEGQVVVYEGYDPSNSAYWSLVGVFDLPAPIGRRCMLKLGGDVGILTRNGLIMMSQALRSIAPGVSTSLTDKIRVAYKQMFDLYGANSGWEMANHVTAGMVLINVPQGTSTGLSPLAMQLVLNTASSGWCAFSGWNPTTITSFGGNLYFASRNKVYRADYGQDDAGSVINVRSKTAFMPMVGGGRTARVSLVRMNFTVSSVVAYKLGIDTDFEADNYASSDSSIASGAPAYWDSALWDTATWDIESVQAKWRTVSSTPGGMTAFRLSAQLKGINLTWNAVDCIVTVGGIL